MGEIEVMTPGQSTIDFDMKNGNFSPGFTGHIEEDYYFSAPASPRQISQFYREFDDFLINNSSIINSPPDVRRNSVSLTVPFDWEEKPGVPKNKFEDDFAFDVSQEMEIASVSADELFRGGKIRPLVDISTEKKKKKKNTEERAAAIRGRERSVSSLSASRSGHRVTRSVSPLRVSEYPWEEEFRKHQEEQQSSKQSSSKPNLTSSVSALSSSSSLKGHKKWKLKDFFLFRSASEGRATDKSDPLKKYASLFKKQDHDIKCSSFRSIDNNSVNSVLHSSRRKGPAVSPHELHYTMNRAVSEDLKKKTFLPYKQGILGRLSFNPAVHAIANGFGFSRKL